MQETPRHSPRHTGCWQCLPPEEQQRICCNCDHAARAEDCVTHQGKHMAIQGILYSAPAAKKKPGVPTGTHQRQIKTITGCTAGGTDSWSQTCLTGLGCRRRARGWMCQQGAGVVQHVNVVRKGFIIPTWNTSRE